MSADDIVLHKPQPVELDVELIKRTICKGADDLELKLFLNQCQRTGLDPFARQIHAVKRWDASVGKEVMQAMIGIDGFRLIADRSGRYVPGREPTFCYDKEGFLLKATAYVNVYRQGTWHEVSDSALYAEYVQTKKSGEPNSMWAKMPHSQLAKCAESRCLRKAFPAELSGLYTSEEMAQSDNPVPSVYIPHADGQRVDTSTGEIVETQTAPEPTEEEKAAAKAEAKTADKAAFDKFSTTAANYEFKYTDRTNLLLLARTICKKERPTATDLNNVCLLRNADWKAAIAAVYAKIGHVEPAVAKDETAEDRLE